MEKVDFRDAIAAQPAMLDRCRDAVQDQVAAACAREIPEGCALVTGIGASHYAALSAVSHWRHQGLPAMAVCSSELYGAAPGLGRLMIALSASGRSVEPIEALKHVRPTCAFGISSENGVPLEAHVDALVTTGCSIDSSPNTASFVGTLQALGVLGDRLGGARTDWDRLSGQMENAIAAATPALERATEMLGERVSIDLVGSQSMFGIAGYGALLLREFPRISAQSWATHNFLHGPMEPNDTRTAVVIFGDGREVPLASSLAGYGIATVLVTSNASITDSENLCVVRLPEIGHGIVAAMTVASVAQLIVGELAAVRGFTSCNFRYRQTDTKIP